MSKKAISKKVYIAIILVAILVIATATIVYMVAFNSGASKVSVGVHAGDIFTYKLTGTAVLFSSDANPNSEYSDFASLNNTDYFKIAITGINGSIVSFDTVWRFSNGTEVSNSQTIDLSNGANSDQNGFWAIYASNLNKNDLLRPTGFDHLNVTDTDTYTYANSSRVRNHFSIQNQFFDPSDPTQSTFRYDLVSLYFDKQTGMLVSLTNIQQYNNPQMNLIITWNLANSTVWTV